MMRLYQKLKNVYHSIQAFAWRWWYGRPDTRLSIVGVTGTNGKTTTSYVLASILTKAYGEEKVGILTTVAFRVGKKQILNATKMTTLPSRLVFSYLAAMVKAGVTHVVLEMTSHALDQGRLYGVKLAGGVVLNMEREHLDYHDTMEEYVRAKQRLVDYLAPAAPLVAKEDDKYVQAIIAYARRKGARVIPFTEAAAQAVPMSLHGEVNRQNVLAASLLARALGLSDDVISRGAMALKRVPGRMEQFETHHGVTVVIDYAVTPEALERLYKEVRGTTKGKVYGVLGAAGLRDRGKRAAMAAAVKRYTDELVITREDPWTESEKQIFSDLEAGLKKDDVSWRRIVDRRKALMYLLKKAKAGDVVVATGKGAETGMAMANEIVPWNERKIIEEISNGLPKAI